MGYYVETADHLTIPLANVDAAWEAAKQLNRRDDLKHGGHYPATLERPRDSRSVSMNPNKWFSWLPWDYDVRYKSLDEFLEELGFESVERDADSLRFGIYHSKTGAEEDFLRALAPFIADNQVMRWKGEDGRKWQCMFKGGRMTIIR